MGYLEILAVRCQQLPMSECAGDVLASDCSEDSYRKEPTLGSSLSNQYAAVRPKSSCLLAHSTDLAHKLRPKHEFPQLARTWKDTASTSRALPALVGDRFLQGQLPTPSYVKRSSLQDGLWCKSTQSRSNTSPLSWEVRPYSPNTSTSFCNSASCTRPRRLSSSGWGSFWKAQLLYLSPSITA